MWVLASSAVWWQLSTWLSLTVIKTHSKEFWGHLKGVKKCKKTRSQLMVFVFFLCFFFCCGWLCALCHSQNWVLSKKTILGRYARLLSYFLRTHMTAKTPGVTETRSSVVPLSTWMMGLSTTKLDGSRNPLHTWGGRLKHGFKNAR